MRIGYLECFAGISGDMLMGALVDAGAAIELLQRTAASLALGAEVRVTKVSRSGIQSTKIDVMVNDQVHEPAAATGPVEQEAAHGHGHHHHHDHDHDHHDHALPSGDGLARTTSQGSNRQPPRPKRRGFLMP
jgi:uncharacterized protein (DUF111 family)